MTETTNTTRTDSGGGPLPGLLRPPIIFLAAILLGVAFNMARPWPFVVPALTLVAPVIVVIAVALFLLSLREFRSAGTAVRGNKRTTAIVRTGPYRFSRNPIYVSFILLLVGLAVWLNDLWLVLTLILAIAFIAMVVIPREERFLEQNFQTEYSSYKASVRRWL